MLSKQDFFRFLSSLATFRFNALRTKVLSGDDKLIYSDDRFLVVTFFFYMGIFYVPTLVVKIPMLGT
ncbi:hypothetical protein DW980_02005 [Bacteroides stercoris]|nr:hypothetical protein DW980_02005 [Bacteroides stercoris]